MEQTILSNLIFNEEYSRKVLPYIKDEYFDDNSHKKIFDTFSEYVKKYNNQPSIESLSVMLSNRKDMNEEMFKNVINTLKELKIDKKTDLQWTIDETEKFCQDKDLYNSIRRSILILDGQDKEFDKGVIPKLLSDSLGISFDSHVGHDFLEDYDSRFDFYHRKDERLPFDIEIFNKITKGGIPKKSMTVLLAQTGGGKSLIKCHMAANALMYGKNVLYITMELAEEMVAQRIDANILDITVDELMSLDKEIYERKINRIKPKTTGKLIIKEYPTASAHVGHFRHLLNELKQKKNFVPDVIFIDYLNICASSRTKGAAASNMYTLVKNIAEEVRGLAMEFNVPIVTSSQYNRGAYGNSDVEMTNVSESIGLAYTADAIFGIITSEEMDQMQQIMIKQLKNRWGDINYYRRFVIGIDRSKMKIYNLDSSAQNDVQNETSSYKDTDEVESKFSKRKKYKDDIS